MKRRRQRPPRLYPELAKVGGQEDPWTVDVAPAGTGGTDLQNHAMMVPAGNAPHDRCIHIHELMHAMHTRGRADVRAAQLGLRELSLQVCEDYRLGWYAEDMTDIEAVMSGGDPTYVLQASGRAAGVASNFEQALHCMLAFGKAKAARDAYMEAFREVNAPMARELQSSFKGLQRAFRRIKDGRKPTQKDGEKLAALLETYLQAKGEGDEYFSAEGRRDDALEDIMGHDGYDTDYKHKVEEGDDPWGEMEIIRPPLVKNHRGSWARKEKASAEGMGIRYPHRILTDGKPFAVTKRARGGSVLYDISGSMNPDFEKINEALRYAPALSLMMYSGDYNLGKLIVLSRNGRICDLQRAYNEHGLGGNLIDGPALKFLGKQPEPRVWVSDGQVTGKGAFMFTALLAEAKKICKRHRITRVPSYEDATEYFKRRYTK